jgi:transposase
MEDNNSIQETNMQGSKRTEEPAFHYFRMHELVPDGHILKLVDKHVNFSFVREKVAHLYSEIGRPSIDPVMMVKMLLVGYLFGITSERRLCEEVGMHVGYRWFVGLNMEDKVPNHSTFSKNRHGRFRENGVWEEIFEEVVRRCIAAGLVSGGNLLKTACTRDKSRTVSIHINNDALELAKRLMGTKAHRISQKCRKRIEALFGEAKEQMGLRRMKFRGRGTVAEQVLLTAAAQNIKRLVKYLEGLVPKPAQQAEVSAINPKNTFLTFAFRLPLELFEYISKSVKSIFSFSNLYEQT